MKSGFTLVELLGVIVILSVIIVFTFPSIINTIKEKNDDADNYQLQMIENATRIYIKDNGLSGGGCIRISDLENSKYLNNIDIQSGTEVTYLNSTYTLNNTCE